jgi:hypothetical protein
LEQAIDTYHDLAARKHNALVSPESIHVDLAAAETIVLDEVLHHRQALPAWNAVLARKRVEPAVDEEVLRVVSAVALDAGSLRAEVAKRIGAGTSGVLRRTEGVEDALELGAPRVDVGRVGDGEVEVLEGRLVRVVFAVEVVHDDTVGALAGPAGAKVADVSTVDKGVAALPVVTDLAGRILRDLLGPPLRALVTLKGLEGRAQDFTTRDEVVAPELDVLEQPGHVDVETLGTAEDRSGHVVGVSSHLRTVEAALSNLEPRVEAQKSGSEKDSNGLQERGVTDAPARLVVVAADVAEEVCLGNEVDEVTNVLGLVVETSGALLVAERI